MNNNIKNIASHIKSQLPNYISSDEEYSKFVRFLELYYNWLSQSTGVSGVSDNITEYGDIDNTLDIFTNLFKNELASVFPNVTKIKSLPQKYSDDVSLDQAGQDTESAIESLYDQEFLADGGTSSYKLNYFNPFYYFGDADAESVVSDVIIYQNIDGTGDRGGGTSLQSFVSNLTPPGYNSETGLISNGDYSKLSEATSSDAGYILQNNVLSFVDSTGNPSNVSLNNIIKVRFVIKTYTESSLSANTTDEYNNLVDSVKVKKSSYENQTQFMKFMKDFYQSKGSEKSYEFLFHALFNEDIEIYYPKNHIFRASNNQWTSTKSVRSEPYTPTFIEPKITTPYVMIGQTSGAEAVIEYYKDIKIGTYEVREYFLGSITGSFSSREMVEILQTDNTKYQEKLYDCITGFNIVDGGSNYSQNQPVELSSSYVGEGVGFSANISHTFSGPVQKIEIINRGDGYITGEELRFNEYGTFGTGAAGFISETDYDTEKYNITFVQNPLSLDTTGQWNLALGTDSNSNPYTFNSTAKDVFVKIENIDVLSDDVFGLFDFENLIQNTRMIDGISLSTEYQDLKNNMEAFSAGTYLLSNESPNKNLINLNEGEVTETRFIEDLNFTIDSVAADGAILTFSYDTASANAQGSLTTKTVNLSDQGPLIRNARGFGATFDLESVDGLLDTIVLNTGGQLYAVGDRLIIKGAFLPNGVTRSAETDLAGITSHDVLLTVSGISAGEVVNGIVENTVDVAGDPLDGYISNTTKGTGAVWNVDTTQGTYKNAVAVLLDGSSPTIDYKVNDKFIIPGNLFGSGSGISPKNDVGIQVTSVDDAGRIDDYSIYGNPIGGEISTFTVDGVLGSSGDIDMPDVVKKITILSSFIPASNITILPEESIIGFGADFNVTRIGSTYHIEDPAPSSRGTNYTVGSTIKILGSQLDGTDGVNDLIILITQVSTDGEILQISIDDTAGVPISVNTFSKTTHCDNKTGTGASFDISVVNGNYTNSLTIAGAGTGYSVGQSLYFSGSDLAFQWIKDKFTSKNFQTGKNSLSTDIGYVRFDDIGKTFADAGLDSTGFTIDFWYFRKSQKLGVGAASAIWSIDDYINGTGNLGLYQESDGTITLKNVMSGANPNTISSSILSFGDWHHIAIWVSAAGVSLYVNSILVGTSSGSDWWNHADYGLQSETVTTFTTLADKWSKDETTGIDTWKLGVFPNGDPITLDPTKDTTIKLTRNITRQAEDSSGVPQNIPDMTNIDVTRNLSSKEYTIDPSGESIEINSGVIVAGDTLVIEYYPRKQNFYIGAHQTPNAEYTIDDYTLGFFGTFRFTKGQRYNTVSGTLIDSGTVNPLSGQGLTANYINPIPSSKFIGESFKIKRSFVVDSTTTSNYNIYYDPNIIPIIEVQKTEIDLLGIEKVTVSILEESDYVSTSGINIVFGGDAFNSLKAGDVITITFHNPSNESIEYIIYDEEFPTTAARNKIFLRKLNNTGVSSSYNLPPSMSLNVSWNAKPKSPIKSIELITGGFGYKRFPTSSIKSFSGSYKSTGSLGFFEGRGENIGKIAKLSIVESSVQTEKNGHGVNYIWGEGTPTPTLDLTTQGDGNAVVEVLTGPLCVSSGSFLNDEGFVSHDNRIHDGYLWQDYSYVIKVGMYVDEWRKIVKKVIHPSGLMMFGEYTSTSKANIRKGAGIAWTELLYEIIKNVNMKVKNMDGLGKWAYSPIDTYWYPTENRQDTNYLNSQGHKFIYDNRQRTTNSNVETDGVTIYDGVGTGEISDDTIGAATVDNGSGRYALLDDTGADVTGWHQVKQISLNYKDSYGKNYSHFYKNDTIHNTVTIYDISDEDIHNNEWIKTRPWGKYKILASEYLDNSNDEIVVFHVSFVAGYREMPIHTGTPGNQVEFRWDGVFRGNVDRSANHWIGSIDNGANPRDEKMIINISGRFNNNIYGDVPTLHTTYKSLERFKFYFRTIYPWQNLSTLFSPQEELQDSPYVNMRPSNKIDTTLSYVTTRAKNNTWFNLPVETGNSTWTANTDGTDHEWRDTLISDILTKSDRKYRAVLDAEIKIRPIYLVISEETTSDGLRNRMGPTNLSIERAKFNEKMQSGKDYNNELLDDNTFEKFISPGTINDKTNFASESTLVKYTTTNIPTTLEDLTQILETVQID